LAPTFPKDIDQMLFSFLGQLHFKGVQWLSQPIQMAGVIAFLSSFETRFGLAVQ
jgi:hypothetical protein